LQKAPNLQQNYEEIEDVQAKMYEPQYESIFFSCNVVSYIALFGTIHIIGPQFYYPNSVTLL